MTPKEPEFEEGDIVVHKGTGNEAVVLWPRFYCPEISCHWYKKYMKSEKGNCAHDLVFDGTYKVEADFGEICTAHDADIYKG